MFVECIDELMRENIMNSRDGGRIFGLYLLSGNSLIEQHLLEVFVIECRDDGGQDILGIVLLEVGIFNGLGFGLGPKLKVGVAGVTRVGGVVNVHDGKVLIATRIIIQS